MERIIARLIERAEYLLEQGLPVPLDVLAQLEAAGINVSRFV